MTTPKHLLLLMWLFLPLSILSAQSGDNLFDPSYVHELRFYFSEDNFWDSLEQNYDEYIDDSGVGVPYLMAALQIDGMFLDTTGVRQKGLSSNYYSTELKKPFKVDLNEFSDGQSYDGIKKFNLHNGACDPGMMRDFLVYDILRKAGVKAPRMSFCRLYFNDVYWGMYGIIEQIDKTFVHQNFADNDGTLIKNIGWSELEWLGPDIDPYLEDFQLKTNEQVDDWSDFLHFLDVLNNSSDEDFPAAIQQVFDVDLYLHVLAVDIMTNNWDSYIDNRRNWYLYHEPAGGKLHWIPWDYNLSLGGDFPISGNPFPPFDSTCYIQANFEYIRLNDGSYQFFDKTAPGAQFWTWDFGDGALSSDTNPTHVFASQNEMTVCLTSRRFEGNNLCENTRCQTIDTGFDPGACNSVQNGSSPFPASDPIFQQVVQQDNYCCEDEWDAFCSVQYFEIAQNQTNDIGSPGVAYNLNFSLLLQDTTKVLIDRLLQVPEFRERYLDISCYLLANNFTEERLFPIIDQQADLIREDVYDDPNFIFSRDYFEYDLGNGSGGGGGAEIPALKWVLKKRFAQMAEDLQQSGHDCSTAFSPIAWHDVVINEFMASNDEFSGITDPDGQSEDWIELFNNSVSPVDLTNFYLSDDLGDPLKWTFPYGTVIQPGSYLVVWADKDEDQQGIHANFKLSKDGEQLLLRHEDGTIIDSLSYGEQVTNLTSARRPNGGGSFHIQGPTILDNNELVSATSEAGQVDRIRIYPNPASDEVTVELKIQDLGNPEIQLNLRDALGRSALMEKRIVGNRFSFSLGHLPDGIYTVEIICPDGRRIVERLLIHRKE